MLPQNICCPDTFQGWSSRFSIFSGLRLQDGVTGFPFVMASRQGWSGRFSILSGLRDGVAGFPFLVASDFTDGAEGFPF